MSPLRLFLFCFVIFTFFLLGTVLIPTPKQQPELIYDVQGCAFIVMRAGRRVTDLWRIPDMDKTTCKPQPGEI